MFDWKVAVLASSLLLAGGIIGCGSTGDDDDASPTPEEASPTPAAPEYLFVNDVTYDCTGVDDSDTLWDFTLENFGWVDDAPTLTIYDNPEWGYENACDVWAEDFTLYYEDGNADWTTGENTEWWYRDDIYAVASSSSQVADENTIFLCESKDFFTYMFCAWDYYYGVEDCVTVGYAASTFEDHACD